MNPTFLAAAANRLFNRMADVSVISLYVLGVTLACVTTLDGPYYYSNWELEHTLFTSASSLQFFVAGLAAYLCFHVARHAGGGGSIRGVRYKLWIPTALAFAYASADEVLCLHERLGMFFDSRLTFYSQLYVRASDDFFVAVYAAGAMIFSVFILKELAVSPKSRNLYLAGIALVLFASMVDYLPRRVLSGAFPRGVEELAEYFAGVSFAGAFIVYAAAMSGKALEGWISSLTGDDGAPHYAVAQQGGEMEAQD